MKKIIALLFTMILGVSLFAQENKLKTTLPSVNIRTLNGEVVNTSTFDNEGKPILITFFALYCKPCLQELEEVKYVYDDWKEETGVKIIAVSIDDSRSISRVLPTVSGAGYEYDFYSDPNKEFFLAIGASNLPFQIILNSKREIVYRHDSYAVGGENEIYELIKKVASEDSVKSN